jgi:hypothetical protein
MNSVILIMVLLCAPAVPGNALENANISTAPVIIEMVGGFGHLTSMELKADGTFTWHGWEPGRKVVSLRKGKLDAEAFRATIEQANRVMQKIKGSEFSGGEDSYTLILRSSAGQKREIKIQQSKPDQRPEELKRLLDSLWATRNPPKKNSL